MRWKARGPLVWCPLSLFLGASSFLFHLSLLQQQFLCISSIVKVWYMQSPLNNWCWDVSATWTLGSIDVGSIWGAVNWQFLWLVTLKNLTSAAEVPPGLSFLGQSSWQLCFIIAFHGFWHSSLRNFQKLFFFFFFNPFPKFQERLTCLKCRDSLLVLWFSLLCGLWGVFTL